jgi:flavin reductase (DIM6/NTAB) family NADH-FMN oxidoreductase RutF
MRVVPGEVKTSVLHSFLVGAVAPRPICFASTIDGEGLSNLSPFSFFNVFGSKPPILVFSPARRVRDNTTKHTLSNVLNVPEVVINVVSFSMVQQMNVASCEYPAGVDEFVKAGFNKIASDFVRPFRVMEAPVSIECKVLNVIETGTEGGAGNLVVCEVLCLHVDDNILDVRGKIDPHKIDLVGRLGEDFYCRASGNAIFEVAKPNTALGIGIDALPIEIKNSTVLTGNHLGVLANYASIPTSIPEFDDNNYLTIIRTVKDLNEQKVKLQHYAAQLIEDNSSDIAWQVLLRTL